MSDAVLDPVDLRRQIEALRERLNETEEVCRALREEEVDAVVVGRGAQRHRVLLMSGAYTRYRQVVEDMDQGAVTVTEAGEILFANHAFAGMLGVPLIDVFHTPLERWVPPEHSERIERLKHPVPGQRDLELALRHRNGPRRVRVSVVTVSDDFITLLVSDLEQAERFDEAAATVDAIRSGAVDGFVIGSEAVQLLEGALAPHRAAVEGTEQGRQATDARTRRFLGMLAQEFGDIIVPIREAAERIHKSKPGRDVRDAALMIDRQADRLLALVEDLRRVNPRD